MSFRQVAKLLKVQPQLTGGTPGAFHRSSHLNVIIRFSFDMYTHCHCHTRETLNVMAEIRAGRAMGERRGWPTQAVRGGPGRAKLTTRFYQVMAFVRSDRLG